MTLKYFLFINLILFCLSGCYGVAFEHGSQRREYQRMGWLKVQKEGDETLERSGYKRLLNEMSFSKAVDAHISNTGLPDYLMIPDYHRLHLAYFKEGVIYELETSVDGKLLSRKSYKDYTFLPQKIITQFQKH